MLLINVLEIIIGGVQFQSKNADENGKYFQSDILLTKSSFKSVVNKEDYLWDDGLVYYEISKQYSMKIYIIFIKKYTQWENILYRKSFQKPQKIENFVIWIQKI